eukprot:2958834-Pleurochrysis_carterae.AAC.8
MSSYSASLAIRVFVVLIAGSESFACSIVCRIKASAAAAMAGVTIWPAAQSSAGRGSSPAVISSKRPRFAPHPLSRVARIACSTPARGQRGSAAELMMRHGRGAMQQSERCASKRVSSPGKMASQTARTTCTKPEAPLNNR